MRIATQTPAEQRTARTTAGILRERRLELGLSHAELARYVSPSCRPSEIDWLESHPMIMPSWIRLQQLAKALEMAVSDLLPYSTQDDAGSKDLPLNRLSS